MILLIATIGTFRVGFGLILFLVVAVAAIVTLLNVTKNLSRHNAMTKEVRKRANDVIRTEIMVSMLVKQAGALLWTRKNGMFHLDKTMQEKLGLDTNVLDFRDSILQNDAKTIQKLRDFFTITKPGNYSMQVYGRMYNNEPHWYSIQMHVADTPEGLIYHGVTLRIDNLKRQEEQEMETQRMLVRAKERSEFLSNMSHQIRTPLNVAVGFSQILCMPEIKLSHNDVQLYGNEIAYHNSRLMKIIDDVLTMTLIGNSNIKMTLQSHHLSEFMDFSQRDTVFTLLKKFKATVKVREGMEDCQVIVDSLFLSRVIDNVVDNAVNASREGSTIDINWYRNDDATVTMEVTDHGCGIPKDEQEKIFERFYRIDKYAPGVGLGLTLSRSLMEKMGGSISVESTVGKGSIFRITMKSAE